MPRDPFLDESDEARLLSSRKEGPWEYLLTAILMKDYLKKPHLKWRQCQAGVLLRPRKNLSETEVHSWFQIKLNEAVDIVRSLATLYSKELQRSWGEPGCPGDAHEILGAVQAIASAAEHAVEWELSVRFANVPDMYVGLVAALENAIGPNVLKLVENAETLEKAIRLAIKNPDEKHSIVQNIVFELPDHWVENIETELRLIEKSLGAI